MNDEKKLVHLFISIENVGDVLLQLCSLDVRVYKITPLDYKKILSNVDPEKVHREIDWEQLADVEEKIKLGTHEYEPAEKAELNFDIILDKEVEIIYIYSYLKNVKKTERDIGWACHSFHPI